MKDTRLVTLSEATSPRVEGREPWGTLASFSLMKPRLTALYLSKGHGVAVPIFATAVFPPSWLLEADSPYLSSEEKFQPITRSQLGTANVGMRWQNLFLELEETLLSVGSCPRKLVVRQALAAAHGPGWVMVSEAAGRLGLCTQNSTSLLGPGPE